MGGQTIKDGEEGAALKEGAWKMDGWVEGDRLEGQVREKWQENKEK